MDRQCVIGVDFGTDSARAIIVDTYSADVVAEASMFYPRWEKKEYCDSGISQYRQHPRDYLEVLETILKEVTGQIDSMLKGTIVGIAIDTTGSTVCPVDQSGMPLAMLDEFSDDPDAMFHLWKDHPRPCLTLQVQKSCLTRVMPFMRPQALPSLTDSSVHSLPTARLRIL